MNDAVFGIHVHDERDAQLSVLVLEEEGGVVPARHLHPLGPVRLAVWDVVGQEVGSAEDVQAVDALEAVLCPDREAMRRLRLLMRT